MLSRIKKKIKRLTVLVSSIFLVLIIGIVLISTIYPTGYRGAIVKYSREYQIDPYLIASIINVESKYDKYAISHKEARGLMQIGPQTGEWASEVLGIDNYNEDILFDPDVNIRIGTWYVDRLFKEFDGNLDLVLAAYNAGSGNVSKWLENEEYCSDGRTLDNIPFKETEQYIIRMKNSYKVYSTVYKKYLLNPSEDDSFYINFLNNIRRTVKEVLKFL